MNTIPQDLTFLCSPIELYTLASLLGGETLIGVPDPFPGWLTEEIKEATQSAQQALADRGYLSLLADGKTVMDVLPAALVGAVSAPNVTFLLTSMLPEGVTTQRGFYYRSPLTVLLESKSENFHLKPLEGISTILNHIKEIWNVGTQKAVRAEPFSVPENAIQFTRETRSEGESALNKVLQQTGVGTKNARSLARTLASPRQNGALVAMRSHGSAWETGGLGILEGENGLWLLRSFTRQGSNRVELTPCSAKRLMNEIETLLGRFLSRMEN